jgi:hypothetical protein
MSASYLKSGLTLSETAVNDPDPVRDLQHDLRALGYLRSGIDGAFGKGTTQALRALQFDLLHTSKPGSDGTPPVSMAAFNKGRVTAITGVLDQGLAACLQELLSDPDVPQLPQSPNPGADNQRAMDAILRSSGQRAPAPFVGAMVMQESNGQHFRVPTGRDADAFIIVGLDRNDASEANKTDHITSRGYGVGQYTLFHHPPTHAEVSDLMLNPTANASHAFTELRLKFDRFLVGPDNVADERKKEHPLLPLRECRYARSDARFMQACKDCAARVRHVTIRPGDAVFTDSPTQYASTQYYPSAKYDNVPDRAEFLCDWPYAVRRYNGSGVNSYHYQTRVLLNLLRL